MNPYQVTKDYYKLWDLVCQTDNTEIICFVDYDYRDGTPKTRDVCKYRKIFGGTILFSVRGMCYGDAFFEKPRKGAICQKDRFMNECRRMNVEWIIPNNN